MRLTCCPTPPVGCPVPLSHLMFIVHFALSCSWGGGDDNVVSVSDLSPLVIDWSLAGLQGGHEWTMTGWPYGPISSERPCRRACWCHSRRHDIGDTQYRVARARFTAVLQSTGAFHVESVQLSRDLFVVRGTTNSIVLSLSLRAAIDAQLRAFWLSCRNKKHPRLVSLFTINGRW